MNPDTAFHFAVIGDPIAHSKSPLMPNAAFRALGMNAGVTGACLVARSRYIGERFER